MSRWVLRFGLAIMLSLVVGFFALGFETYSNLSKREEEMRTFVRLSVQDALVNIQTTEEYGLDSTKYLNNTYGRENFTSGYSRSDEQADYRNYLVAINSQLADEGKGNADNLEIIQAFLDLNQASGGEDAMFRPVEFGMTYVSESLFKASFKQSLYNLVKANYDSVDDGEAGFEQVDALYLNWDKNHIDNYIKIEIDGPKAEQLPKGTGTANAIYKSVYGVDKALEAFASKPNLGFESASIDFFIYYDIRVTVDWKSTSRSQFMNLGWLEKYGFIDDPTGEIFDPQGFMRISGKPIEYSYRYVLTN